MLRYAEVRRGASVLRRVLCGKSAYYNEYAEYAEVHQHTMPSTPRCYAKYAGVLSWRLADTINSMQTVRKLYAEYAGIWCDTSLITHLDDLTMRFRPGF